MSQLKIKGDQSFDCSCLQAGLAIPFPIDWFDKLTNPKGSKNLVKTIPPPGVLTGPTSKSGASISWPLRSKLVYKKSEDQGFK
jgi:hypothetical protein